MKRKNVFKTLLFVLVLIVLGHPTSTHAEATFKLSSNTKQVQIQNYTKQNITLYVRDSKNRPVSGKAVRVSTKFASIASAPSTVYVSNGTVQIPITARKIGQTTLTLTVDKTSIRLPIIVIKNEDSTPPSVSGVYDGQSTREKVLIHFEEGAVATLVRNGSGTQSLTNGGKVERDGNYELTVTDQAVNRTYVRFTIDTTAPKLNVEDGYYRTNIKVTYNEGTATYTKNNVDMGPLQSGITLDDEGIYKIQTVDALGNTGATTITIDKTAPKLWGTPTKVIKDTVRPIWDDANTKTTAYVSFNGGAESVMLPDVYLIEGGTYRIRIIDQAGNEVVETFRIDKSGPILYFSPNLNPTTNSIVGSVTISISDGAYRVFRLTSVNGTKEYTTGTTLFIRGVTTITTPGTYLIETIDSFGNQTSKEFTVTAS
ncbi:MAG: hypothetical protein ACRCWQ_03880 [Bacilli bacterium]